MSEHITHGPTEHFIIKDGIRKPLGWSFGDQIVSVDPAMTGRKFPLPKVVVSSHYSDLMDSLATSMIFRNATNRAYSPAQKLRNQFAGLMLQMRTEAAGVLMRNFHVHPDSIQLAGAWASGTEKHREALKDYTFAQAAIKQLHDDAEQAEAKAAAAPQESANAKQVRELQAKLQQERNLHAKQIEKARQRAKAAEETAYSARLRAGKVGLENDALRKLIGDHIDPAVLGRSLDRIKKEPAQ